MGHSGSSAKGGAAGSGGKGWGDAVKAGLNPIADFTGVKDPLVGSFGKTMQKYSPNDNMTSTYDSRAKEYADNAQKWEDTKARASEPKAQTPLAKPQTRGRVVPTSLLTEDEDN